MTDNETGSLIPDPETNGAAGDLPTASIIPNEAPSVPADNSLMNDTGSLVPDEAVTNMNSDAAEAPVSEKTLEAAPVEQKPNDDSYTVPPEPDLPVAGVVKNESEKKEKKPANKKLIAIIAGSIVGVAALTLLVIFVIVPLIGNLTRGQLDNKAKSFFVREKLDDGNYAVYSEDGKPLTGFVYGSATDFIDGYALVTDESGDNFGIISSGGKMSVEYGTYTKIQRYGALYDVSTSAGAHKLITGDNSTVAEYSGKVNTFDGSDLVQFVKDDKYLIYDGNGQKVLEIDSSENPEIKFDKNKPFYVVFSKKHVYIIDENTNQIKYEQETKVPMTVSDYSSDFACVLLRGDNSYGISYGGKYQEISKDNLSLVSIEGSGSLYEKDDVPNKTSCYFYTDKGSTSLSGGGYHHPNYRMMDKSFNFVAVPAYNTKENGDYVYYMRIDPTHYVKIINGSYPKSSMAQIYSDGKVVNTIKSDMSFSSSYSSVVIDGKYYLVVYDKNVAEYKNRTTYNAYDIDGKLVESSKEKRGLVEDAYGNRIDTSNGIIYDKDYKIKFDGDFSYGSIKSLNNKYFVDNKDFKYIVDPESGKELIRDGIYKELSYNKQNNMYVGVREDNSTDIIDSEGNVVGNFPGKVTLKQNHVHTRGGSVSELYTLKGEKFYTYE